MLYTKNNTDFACYIFYIHQSILIIFRRNSDEIILSSKLANLWQKRTMLAATFYTHLHNADFVQYSVGR